MFFNIGPAEFLVLAIVGLLVLGPDRLPTIARDAARMLRTLRELTNGARSQLRDELGPEFADMDLRSLNPRTAIQKAIFGDEDAASTTPPTVDDVKPVSRPPVQPPLGRNEAAPYDSDAT